MRALFLGLLWLFTLAASAAEKPNIVVILTDDLGYGDVGCYGATRVKTPRIDALAAGGLRFTDAHSSAATCTPSRFSLLTGLYPFRQKGTGILAGDAGLIVNPGRVTLPGLLQKAGYATAAVGKWHLGLGSAPAKLNWNGEIQPGPLEVGFSTCFIMPATADRVPCVYLRDHRIVGLDPADPIRVSYEGPLDDAPTGKKNPELLKVKPSHGHDQTIVNGISRIGFQSGGRAALWDDETLGQTLTAEAVKFIEQNQARPFFLYFATHDIHVPRVPNPRFAGETTMGPRGDVIAQLDWETGEILDTLERLHLTSNTLVIFSSDNGPVVNDGYIDESVVKLGDHKPAGPWRGGKYSAFEGGTRVPFVVSWPGRIQPGTSAALLCQVDLLASLAALVGESVPAGQATDSQNCLPALLGQAPGARADLAESASVLALRAGAWKYIRGGKGPRVNLNSNSETGIEAQGQLFNLEADPGEKKNLVSAEAGKAGELAARLSALEKESAP